MGLERVVTPSLPARPMEGHMNTNNGLCECGCGQPAPICKHTDKRTKYVKGEPSRFISGHHSRGKAGELNGKFRPLAERFWEKVNKQGSLPSAEAVRVHPDIANTQCWLWTASFTRGGYGGMAIGDGTNSAAHRVAWFLEHGRWPSKLALHKCDVRACVRASHLFDGDYQDNVDDMLAKGRQVVLRGEENGLSKFTTKDVHDIRTEVANGQTQASLAQKHSVAAYTIQRLVNGQAWSHVSGGSRVDIKVKYRRQGNPTLNDKAVLRIRAKRKQGASLEELADIYGVSRSAIGDVCDGTTWKHSLPLDYVAPVILRRGKTSRLKGVSWSKVAKKWQAQIVVNKQHNHFGYFVEENKAGYIYDAGAIKLLGSKATTNVTLGFLPPQEII